MRRIDELHLTHPFLGARRLARMLQREGVGVGRRHVGTLILLMGIEAIYRTKRTRLPDTAHRIYPYLLREAVIERPNQVWATDVAYLPTAKGFAYLVATLDLYSRTGLALRVSNTLATDVCIEVLEEALHRDGTPEISNTDQGSQFTDADFTAALDTPGVRISMDGTGRCIDNVVVERLWRSVKYESIYLHARETPREVNVACARYVDFFNAHRPHQSLDYRTSDEMYFGTHELTEAV
jgi:putative transposase